MFLEVTGGEELYRVKKTEGERRMKEQSSPANADEQGIVKGEGCTCKIEKQVLEEIYRLVTVYFPSVRWWE